MGGIKWNGHQFHTIPRGVKIPDARRFLRTPPPVLLCTMGCSCQLSPRDFKPLPNQSLPLHATRVHYRLHSTWIARRPHPASPTPPPPRHLPLSPSSASSPHACCHGNKIFLTKTYNEYRKLYANGHKMISARSSANHADSGCFHSKESTRI